jgi:hypothetical protein
VPDPIDYATPNTNTNAQAPRPQSARGLPGYEAIVKGSVWLRRVAVAYAVAAGVCFIVCLSIMAKAGGQIDPLTGVGIAAWMIGGLLMAGGAVAFHVAGFVVLAIKDVARNTYR